MFVREGESSAGDFYGFDFGPPAAQNGLMDKDAMDALSRTLGVFLPQVEGWIDHYVDRHAAEARTIASLQFPRLPACFSPATLQEAKVVRTGKIEKPPLSQLGLAGFDAFERMGISGITYKNVFFINPALARDESLHFHELIHVIQWRVAGVKNFILAYALGLMEFGYRDSPLEAMAYDLQARFDAGETIPNLESFVARKTQAVIADPTARL